MSLFPTTAALFERLPRTLRRHRLMKAWMRLTGEDPLQRVRIRDQAFGYADMSNGFLRLIVIDGDFEADFFRLADRLLEQGGIFFDAGANHGLLSFGLAARHGANVEFHLFEPNPALVASIRKSMALHPQMRCEVNTAAVSRHSGFVPFFIDLEHSGTSHVADDGDRRVASIALDDYIDERNIAAIDLLKLDIEGHELAALEGARRSLAGRRIGAVYFEYFEKWLVRTHPPIALLNYLADAGYAACFCRTADFVDRGGATHSLRGGLPGAGIPLLPVAGLAVPPMTDLLAVPAENLVRRDAPRVLP